MDPRTAIAAFWWASRLDPLSAEMVYARGVALMLSDPGGLGGFLRRDSRTLASPEGRQLDSLMRRALILDPFFHTWLEDVLITKFVEQEVTRSLRMGGLQPSASEISFEVTAWLRNEPRTRATLDYARGRFAEALENWAGIARSHPRQALPRVLRARAFYLAGNLDSAAAELTAGIRIARERDAEVMQYSYESRAAWEYALGRIFERQGRPDSARAAYERSLVEELAYYPSHLRLGILGLVRADTAAALLEFARAVAVKDDEYQPRLMYGAMLNAADQLDSAETHLRRASELEPWAAAPRRVLANILERRGDAAAAATAYEQYLARAARSDPGRAGVPERIERLRGRP